ncbi:MAG: GTP-binding protein [Candidatus Thermoplasmatota archaeon]
MPTIEEQIRAIEEEIRTTEYNKKTQHHIGRLKAKLAKLRAESEKREKKKRSGVSFSIKKSGNATVAIVGYPNVGKSTLLNKLTSAKSEIGDYSFTTLKVTPGIMEYNGAEIQIFDLPGLIEGSSEGKGRGREVLGVIKSADLILLLIDVFNYDTKILLNELMRGGIRVNEKPKEIIVKKKDRGGINVSSTFPLTIDDKMIKNLFNEFGYINADVIIKERINEEELIDYLAGNKYYIPAILVLNKIDMSTTEELKKIETTLPANFKFFPISAEKNLGFEELKKGIYDALSLMRVYMKPLTGKVDYNEPLVIKKGYTVEDVCITLHKDFKRKFKYALVSGKSAKFPGQRVGLKHILMDEDTLTLVVEK